MIIRAQRYNPRRSAKYPGVIELRRSYFVFREGATPLFYTLTNYTLPGIVSMRAANRIFMKRARVALRKKEREE